MGVNEMPPVLRIGSRPSALALAQSGLIKRRLEASLPGLRAEIIPISTSGDRMAAASLARVGGKGLFIRELEQALTAGRVDIAVHSMKDLPALLSPRFRVPAVPRRENPLDALVTRGGAGLNDLAVGARLGTSSIRRRLEASRARPDLQVVPLRGNVDTRLRRLEAGDFDGIILAIAGLRRLGRADDVPMTELDGRLFVPAGGQGALALEALVDGIIGGSAEIERAIAELDDIRSAAEVAAERGFLDAIGASCASPVGVRAIAGEDSLRLNALLFSIDGARSMAGETSAPCLTDPPSDAAARSQTIERAAAIGSQLGRSMLDRGAAELIAGE
jgi:hydroxymethylbilane synthase